MDVAWSFAVEHVIQEESQPPCRSIPFDKEPQDSVIRGVRLGVGTDGETDRAVRSGATPVFVAALHFGLPFRDATHLSLFPSFDGLGRAVFSAFPAYLAEVLHTDIDRRVLDEGQIGSHHGGPDPWSVLGSDDETEPAQLPQPGVMRHCRGQNLVVAVEVGSGVVSQVLDVGRQADSNIGDLHILDGCFDSGGRKWSVVHHAKAHLHGKHNGVAMRELDLLPPVGKMTPGVGIHVIIPQPSGPDVEGTQVPCEPFDPPCRLSGINAGRVPAGLARLSQVAILVDEFEDRDHVRRIKLVIVLGSRLPQFRHGSDAVVCLLCAGVETRVVLFVLRSILSAVPHGRT